MKNKIFAVSALALALAACDDNDVTAGTNNVEGTVGINGIATSGIPFIGTELSADVADANGLESSTEIAYQWMSDGTAIANATGNTYVLTDAEDGAVITVSAVYTDNDGFDESVLSPATEVVTVAPVNDPATVSITGDTFSGSVLTAEVSDANGTENITVTYVWRRDGVIDESITTETYTLLESDIGSVFTVQVTFTDNIDAEEDATSLETAVITAPLGDVTRVAEISDTINGDTGELRIDEFGPLVTGALRFRFSRDNLLSENFPDSNDSPNAAGEITTPASFLGLFGTSTSSQNALIDLRMDNNGILSLRNADNDTVTQNIVIDETFEDGVFTEVFVTWDATNASVADNIQPQVTIAIDGEQITDAPFDSPAFESNRTIGNVAGAANDPDQGLANVVGGVATIQWRMGDGDEIVIGNFRIDDIVVYSDVAATTEVFSEDFEAIDIDTALATSVALTGATIDGSTVDTVVTQFIEGEAATDDPGSVAISGFEIVGSDLTATVTDANGVVSDAISYQWMRGGVDIVGAESITYTLVDADEGELITVTADYTDVDGFDAINVSPATGAIQPLPLVFTDNPLIVDGLAVAIQDTFADIADDPTTPDIDETDTSNGDSGELRLNFADILSGSASVIINRANFPTNNVRVILGGESTSSNSSQIEVNISSGGTVDFDDFTTTAGLDAAGRTAAPGTAAETVSVDEDQDIRINVSWVGDSTGVNVPTLTVTINDDPAIVGFSTANDLADVVGGVGIFQIIVGNNDDAFPGFVLVDNIVITDDTSTTGDVINIDFEDINEDQVIDELPDNAPFDDSSEDSTVVDSATFSVPAAVPAT